MIAEFKGSNHYLSNFYSAPVYFEGVYYRNNEAAFQSAKILDVVTRRKVFSQIDPSVAKKLGRSVILRPDWEQVKDGIMEEIVRDKFTRNYQLRQFLLTTGNKQLVEGNTWNDTYWGICDGVGQNKLGKILMKIRAELSPNAGECCDDLKDFIRVMNKVGNAPIGSGEISGYLGLEIHNGQYMLQISDGWNSIPWVHFKYCPYCGKEQPIK